MKNMYCAAFWIEILSCFYKLTVRKRKTRNKEVSCRQRATILVRKTLALHLQYLTFPFLVFLNIPKGSLLLYSMCFT